MTWKDRMYAGLGEHLRSLGIDAVAVTSLAEDVSFLGPYGCDTCGPEYDRDFTVNIYYKNSAGRAKAYSYEGTFVDLINSIA